MMTELFDEYPVWGFLFRWSLVVCMWEITAAFVYRLKNK
nr:MAG TPA: hypothetical protein [Caudoviricetes sp.]